MADDLDPLDEPPVSASTNRLPFGSPRFARLVQSPTARRVSPKRLAGAILVGVSLVWGVYELGMRLARSVGHWVAAQPEHQIPFAQIELIPEPPPYIRSGTIGILDRVRDEAKYGQTIPVLDTDLEALRVALSRNPWIERAGPVRTSYRHLAVNVSYRKPVATVLVDGKSNESVLIDSHGVELPVGKNDLEWAESRSRIQVAGESKPLIRIFGLGPAAGASVGLIWKSTDPRIDDNKVIQAAQLAEFLTQHAGQSTPQGRPTPDFGEIHYSLQFPVHPITRKVTKISGFFVRDLAKNWVFWNSGPGSELGDEPTAAEKWSMLDQYIDRHGPLSIKRELQYLSLADRPTDPKGLTLKTFNMGDSAAQLRPAGSPGR